MLDPTSRGNGGAAVLRQAGVDVEIGVLAAEALSVLQPWLTATRRRRPHLTWTLSLPAAADTTPEHLAAPARQQTDLVVFPDRIEEGIPGGHRPGRLRVPPAPPAPADADAFLAEAFAGGTRTILLTGDSHLARELLALDRIDRVTVSVPRSSPDRALATQDLLGEVLSRFTVHGVTAQHDRITIDARRDPSESSSGG